MKKLNVVNISENKDNCGCTTDVFVKQVPCGCEPVLKDSIDDNIHWIIGSINTLVGPVKKIDTEWKWADRLGAIKSRMGYYRMSYTVKPGLYAVGDPDENSNVFVSANYKLSFDHLRRSLQEIDGWIIVLDTKGINVWCAAGKGTFGTDELIKRISESSIADLVNHKRIIVPQLGAPGVDAPYVQKSTGFKVYYGPIRSDDLNEYIENGCIASDEMRRIKFKMFDRFILTPMELNPILKKLPIPALVVLIIFGLQPSGIIFKDALVGGWPFLVSLIIAIFTGAFLTPLLLPFIPSRSFAIKGWITGIIIFGLMAFYVPAFSFNSPILLGVLLFFFPLLSSFIALQFTGSTTYTGMSGVKKELKITLPIYLCGTLLTFILLISYKIIEWGLI